MWNVAKVGVMALLFILLLGCTQEREDHVGVQEQLETGNLSPAVPTEPEVSDGLDREPPVIKRAWQLPSDFPLPESAKIRISRSHKQDGKQEVFMLFETTLGLQAATDQFADYLRNRIEGEMLQSYQDGGKAWLEVDDLDRGEAWSLIGHEIEQTDEEAVEWVINWWEL